MDEGDSALSSMICRQNGGVQEKLSMFHWFKNKQEPPDMNALSSEKLMVICDRFWYPGTGDYGEFVLAYNVLATRGPEIRDWCRRLLTHPDYEAREPGAFLLGQLGFRKQLGDAVEAVIAELGALTRRPVEDDCKETQAISAAITALAKIGDPAGIPHLRAVLFSNDKYIVGDTQWTAADALAQLVGQNFMDRPDPVEAARVWLLSHPHGDAG
jgi:PBS lyase HEAT-like repeat